MDYRYHSGVGTFLIRRRREAEVELLIDDIPISTYESPQAAWRDIALRTTGWDEWDSLTRADVPELENWEEIPEQGH